MNNKTLDKLILGFLQDNIGEEFQIKDMRELVDRSLQINDIQRSLGRLRKKNLVSRRSYGKVNKSTRYWKANERHWKAKINKETK